MELKDLHVHTTYSDGKNTPEEMVQAAIAAGLHTLGFSDHSYTAFDERYCIAKDKISAYKAEIAALREKYRDRIRILCGIEQDYYSDETTAGYDFVIGSVHYVKCGKEFLPVDEEPQILKDAVSRYFSGDVYALCEAYYRTAADVVRKTGATIIGHFDLITKFNEKVPLFDEQHPRYRAAWQAAADTLLSAGVPFEVNTGAISRGWRTAPYPAPEIRDYIRAHGGQFLASSDSHRADTLCLGFDTLEL